MLTLSIPTEPTWIDLPRDVRLQIRPITTAVVAAAQSASLREAEALRDAWDPGGLDLADPDVAKGVGFALMVKALARYAVLEWEGVGDTSGEPLPCTPENIAPLMDLDEMATAFWRDGPFALRRRRAKRIRRSEDCFVQRARITSQPGRLAVVLAKFCQDGHAPGMSTMNVSLPEALKAFVDQQVESGGYSTSSEYVRELIRKDQERQRLRGLLLAGAESRPGSVADDAYFNGLRRRVRGARKA